MFYYAVRLYFDVVFIFELLSTLSMFPRVPRAGCLVLFRILAQFGFTQGGQEYTPKVDWFKLNKYFYKLTTSSQPTATHFLISPEKNKSQILIFRNHFCSKEYHFSSKMFNFHSEMVNLDPKLSFCSKIVWKVLFSINNVQFQEKNANFCMFFEWKRLGWVLICSWIRILWSPGGAGEQ